MDALKHTDRELLEPAAKAAGLKDAVWDDYYECISYTGENGLEDCPWNPLKHRDQVFGLMVKLRLEIIFDGDEVRVYNGTQFFVENGPDLCAATRRAIVRAAAAIGKTMP